MKRLLVTGSRWWRDGATIRFELDLARFMLGDAILVHGDCRGADRIAADIWSEWGLPVQAYPADWAIHGRAAGPIRNQAMVDAGAHACLAFIGVNSKGTADCVARARAAWIPVRTVRAQ